MNPAFTLVGATDDRAAIVIADLYGEIKAPLIRTSVEVAEVVKYASNAFHAVKVCFANEIGNICKAVGIDSHRSHEHFLAGPQSESFLVLLEARVRLWGLLPAQRCQGHYLSCKKQRRLYPASQRHLA